MKQLLEAPSLLSFFICKTANMPSRTGISIKRKAPTNLLFFFSLSLPSSYSSLLKRRFLCAPKGNDA